MGNPSVGTGMYPIFLSASVSETEPCAAVARVLHACFTIDRSQSA
jgi:hypothetical protein